MTSSDLCGRARSYLPNRLSENLDPCFILGLRLGCRVTLQYSPRSAFLILFTTTRGVLAFAGQSVTSKDNRPYLYPPGCHAEPYWHAMMITLPIDLSKRYGTYSFLIQDFLYQGTTTFSIRSLGETSCRKFSGELRIQQQFWCLG